MSHDVETKAWGQLTSWLRSAGAAPPLLLTSTNSQTLVQIATALAQLSFCSKGGEYPCKQCQPCRAVASETHPDFLQLHTEKATLTIKDVRALLAKLAVASLHSQRLVIIHDVDKASAPTCNALLKSLEEPAVATRFILTTRWPRRLLATLRSRCHQVNLSETDTVPALSIADIPALLQRLATAQAGDVTPEDLAALAQALQAKFRHDGPSPELKRAFMRLRDYYLITSRRGNSKLAREVLLLSLP